MTQEDSWAEPWAARPESVTILARRKLDIKVTEFAAGFLRAGNRIQLESEVEKIREEHRKGTQTLKLQTELAFEDLERLDWDKMAYVHVYTDGAFSPGKQEPPESPKAAWGMVVLAQLLGGGLALIGIAADSMTRHFAGRNSRPHYFGATEPSALTAEGAGACWALLWFLQSGLVEKGIGIAIHIDNKAALASAAGMASWKPNKDMRMVLRGLAQVAAEMAPVDWQHVKGHSGDPWNELADDLATTANRGSKHSFGVLPMALLGDFEDCLAHLPWAWMQSAKQDSSLPEIQADGQRNIAIPTQHSRVAPETATKGKVHKGFLKVKLGSLNVQTMGFKPSKKQTRRTRRSGGE